MPYVFLGWSKNPDATCAEYTVGDKVAVSEGIDLYGVCFHMDNNQSTEIRYWIGEMLVLKTNYSNVSPDGTLILEPAGRISKDYLNGMWLKGWTTNKEDLNFSMYAPGETIPVKNRQGIDLYAVLMQPGSRPTIDTYLYTNEGELILHDSDRVGLVQNNGVWVLANKPMSVNLKDKTEKVQEAEWLKPDQTCGWSLIPNDKSGEYDYEWDDVIEVSTDIKLYMVELEE